MSQQGQTLIEYLLLTGVVMMALIYMGTDFKRGIQSVVKVTADQLGNQANSDQDFTMQAQQGFLVNSTTNTWQGHEQGLTQRFGMITTQTGDFTEQVTNSFTNESLTPSPSGANVN